MIRSYARTFAHWETSDTPTLKKLKQQGAFSLLMQAIDAELNREDGR